MLKKAYITQMSYEVSDVEKQKAETALIHFNHVLKLLSSASDYLNLMKTPFKENPEMDSKSVLSARAAIRRFRDKAVDNFNKFKTEAFSCVNSMQEFASDTQTVKLVKSFISSIESLENDVNEFSSLFSDLESNDFSKKVVDIINKIQEKCDSIEEIVDDRIKSHIQTNILAKSWVDSIGNDMNMKIEKKTPLMLELFNKRQDQLNDAIKERTMKS
jgi:hypothetical protein